MGRGAVPGRFRLGLKGLRAGLLAVAFCWLATPSAAQAPAGQTPDFSGLVQTLQPAVVNIQVRGQDQRLNAEPFAKGSTLAPYNEFFREHGPVQSHILSAAGSGFLIDAQGTVVTNAHVIDSVGEIEITLHDGRKLPATLLGQDRETDLAVLKIKGGKNLPFVRFATDGLPQAGQWVMAIGNPFGLGGSVSVGVVSAVGRDISHGRYDAFIQTDAAINQGNSGGPLFDARGRVVGVNSAILSPSGNSVGVGFAIPADLAASVVRQIIEHGAPHRGFLGVETQDVTPDLAARFGLKAAKGALVTRIFAGAPAAEAGVQRGDVIVHLGGQSIDNARKLSRVAADIRPFSTVGLGLVRDGVPMGMAVTLGQLREPSAPAPTPPESAPPEPVAEDVPLGVVLGDAPGEAQGARVVRIAEDSPARGLLQPGDLVLEIELERVNSGAEAREAVAQALAAYPNRPVLMMVHRRGGFVYRAIRP